MCFEDVADSVDDLGSLVCGDGTPRRAGGARDVHCRVDVVGRRSNAGLAEVIERLGEGGGDPAPVVGMRPVRVRRVRERLGQRRGRRRREA